MANDSGNSSVLFICHESSRTGAPLILLNFLKWLKQNTDLPFSIIIRKGGELDDEYRAIAPVLVLYPRSTSFFLWRRLNRIRLSLTLRKRIDGFIKDPVALVYSNTFSNGELTAWLKKKSNTKLVTHVHELGGVIDSLGKKNMDFVLKSTDHFIAASHAVKKVLTGSYHIPESAVSVVHEFLVSFTSDPVVPADVMKMIRENNKKFIVGAVGFADYRKGFDLFLDTAALVINDLEEKEIFFLWVGDFGRGKKELADRFIATHQLRGHVLFTGPAENPSEYYNIFDLVYLPSREDPFPLAMIESSWHAKPVMCFRESGGMPEFVDDTTGILVEDFNTKKAAEKIAGAASGKDRLSNLGMNAKDRVEKTLTIEKIAPVLFGIIKDNIKEK